jgi:hypothetical protein
MGTVNDAKTPILADDTVDTVQSPIVVNDAVDTVQSPILADDAVDTVQSPILADDAVDTVQSPILADDIVATLTNDTDDESLNSDSSDEDETVQPLTWAQMQLNRRSHTRPDGDDDGYYRSDFD